MKFPRTLTAVLLTLGWITNSQAQSVISQNFGSTTSPGSYSRSITLTTTGPLILQLGVEFNTNVDQNHQPPGPPNITIRVDQQTPVQVPAEAYVVTQHPTDPNNGQVYTTDISTLNYTTGPLAAGDHTLTLTFPAYFDTGVGLPSGLPTVTGGYTIIAPNEPPTGLVTAVASLQSSINTIQSDEATDASQISILQANVAANAAAITALQTSEANDAAAISTLQSQLATVQTTLQGEINGNSAAITTLQNRVTADDNQIAALQNLDGGNSATLAALQQQQQTDENNLATLQSQQADIQSSLTNLHNQISSDETAQATENTLLQNQITALQGGFLSGGGLQDQINSLNKSRNFTQTLSYAGLGVGVAGLGTGIGAILFDDSNGDASSVADPSEDPTDSSASSKKR